MSDFHSPRDSVLVSDANGSRMPADRASHEAAAAPEPTLQRVGAEQYLEALRQGIMLSS
jgi:hypothetical protein